MPFEPPPVQHVTPRLVRIPVPLPFFRVPINVYVILGSEPTLVDTGPLSNHCWDYMSQQLDLLGLKPADLRHLVITHAHVDHHGMVARLHAASGAKVWVHEHDATAVFDFHQDMETKVPVMREIFEFWGLTPEHSEKLTDMRSYFAKMGDGLPRDSFQPITPGAVTFAPDLEMRAFHSPGHTEGQVCLLWEEDSGWLFSGDHVLEFITPNPGLYVPRYQGARTGLGQYMESLENLRGTLPEDGTVLPGHGAPFGSLERRIDGISEHHQRRRQRLHAALQEDERNIVELTTVLWPNLPPEQTYLACREVHGHLDMLVGDGLASVKADSHGVGRWSAQAAEEPSTPAAPSSEGQPS